MKKFIACACLVCLLLTAFSAASADRVGLFARRSPDGYGDYDIRHCIGLYDDNGNLLAFDDLAEVYEELLSEDLGGVLASFLWQVSDTLYVAEGHASYNDSNAVYVLYECRDGRMTPLAGVINGNMSDRMCWYDYFTRKNVLNRLSDFDPDAELALLNDTFAPWGIPYDNPERRIPATSERLRLMGCTLPDSQCLQALSGLSGGLEEVPYGLSPLHDFDNWYRD